MKGERIADFIEYNMIFIDKYKMAHNDKNQIRMRLLWHDIYN